MHDTKRILTINSGSSSIKFSLYGFGPEKERLLLKGLMERIGLGSGSFTAKSTDGRALVDERLDMPGHDIALKRLFGWLDSVSGSIDAIGHRVVHGGADYTQKTLIDQRLLKTLKELMPYAPEHLPHEIKAIEAAAAAYPMLPQAACFDTSFHRGMPSHSMTYPIPCELTQEGIIRYGFHGLSYEYIMEELESAAGKDAAEGRVVIAHLGNGASMAAVKDGKSFDTTMGFTPAAGLMMSRRTGDLDPGILLYLLKEKSMSADGLNELVNQKSGLLGVSGVSTDMRDLIERSKDDRRAAFAVELFCYIAKKFLGAYAAALGGLDTLVFTGGIGENSPEIRRRMTKGLEFMGVRIDDGRNEKGFEIISDEKSGVVVRVMKTNEELMIARQTRKLLG